MTKWSECIKPNDPIVKRRLWRFHGLVRKQMLLERVVEIESLQSGFLAENNFEAGAMLGKWGEEDQAEMDDLDYGLALYEQMDGPVTEEMKQQVDERLKELYE